MDECASVEGPHGAPGRRLVPEADFLLAGLSKAARNEGCLDRRLPSRGPATPRLETSCDEMAGDPGGHPELDPLGELSPRALLHFPRASHATGESSLSGCTLDLASPPPEDTAAMDRHGVIPPLTVYIEK